MASKSNPTSRKEAIVVKELEGEVLIYDLRIDKAYCLNETSALFGKRVMETKAFRKLVNN